MNSSDIAKEVKKTLLRYRTGLISLDQSKQELALLVVMLKAYEIIVIEDKLDRLEAIVEDRKR